MINNPMWWQGSAIYQVYPRSFYDSNGDGIGDLVGVLSKLDYIAKLGVDAIWLSPFFASPQADFGYDVADYLSVDPIFGTLDDFDVLISRAHALGLKIIIDQVWGHTSKEHAWFRHSRVSQTNAKADWFVWADPAPDGSPPNNWLSVFGGPAWTWEPRRRQYYMHHFLSDQPTLNYANPEVLEAMLATSRFWLDRGVDGFRLDAVDFFMHDTSLRSNPAATVNTVPAKLFGMQHHVHDVLQPARFVIYEAIRSLMDEYPGTTTIGEVSSQPGAFDRVVSYTSGKKYMHMAYTLGHMRGEFSWQSIRNMLVDAANTGDGHVCWSFSNHDTIRAITRWMPSDGNRNQFACLLLYLLICLPGSICIYQGEELGLSEADLTYEQLRDPFGIAYWPEFKGRDGSRTPIPWNEFIVGESWLPIPDNHLSLAVTRQEFDSQSLLHTYRRALSLRRNNPVLRYGSFELLEFPEPVVAFIREFQGQKLLCVFNLSPHPVELDSVWHQGRLQGFEILLLMLPEDWFAVDTAESVG